MQTTLAVEIKIQGQVQQHLYFRMEVNMSVVSAPVASERVSGSGRHTNVKASKDDETIGKVAVDSDPQGDSSEALQVGILPESKSKKGIKSAKLKKSKSLSKIIGGAEAGGAGAGGAETEGHRSEKSSSEKHNKHGSTTLDGAIKHEKGDAIVSGRTPGSKPGRLSDSEKPVVRKAVEKWKKHAFRTGSRMNLYSVVQTVPPEYRARSVMERYP